MTLVEREKILFYLNQIDNNGIWDEEKILFEQLISTLKELLNVKSLYKIYTDNKEQIDSIKYSTAVNQFKSYRLDLQALAGVVAKKYAEEYLWYSNLK